ncbi:MAG: YfhO family protein, partial [Anaerolineae bacterium]
QSGLFYPFNLLLFLLLPAVTVQSLELLAIFHFWLAGLGMFLYLQHSPLARRLKLHPLAALTGAVAFEFSDLFIVHFGNLNMIAVAAWLPLVMLAFQTAVRQKRVGPALAAGGLLAVATLAGHMQITLFMVLALALYAVWEALAVERGPAPLRYLLLALVVTVGLSGLWLVPTLHMSRYTPRADLPYPEAAAFSLHPAQLIGLLIPNYFGRDPALHWGPWSRVETGYIGVLTLLLALVGAVLKPGRQTRFLLILGGAGFLLALGDTTILHGWLSLSPGFGQFRAPARYILLLDFALAALAAVGLNALMDAPTGEARRRLAALLKLITRILGSLTVISLPLAYFALLITQDRHPDIFRRAQGAVTGVVTFALLLVASLTLLHLARTGRLRKTALGLGAALIITLDLFSVGANVDVGYADPAGGYNHPAALAFLRQNLGLSRVEVTTDVWHVWQPNFALLYGLYDAWGLYNPLTLADTSRYWQQVGPRRSAAYSFLGVKYIIAGKGGAPADGDIVPVFNADPGINIYLNRGALPRALFVSQAIFAPSHQAAWEALKSPQFNPAATVILEDVPPAWAVNGPADGDARLEWLDYTLHHVSVAVAAGGPGYLVLSDAYFPGWRATVDGRPAPLYRANYAFRAVPVPAGEHVVAFNFKPVSWVIGLALSGLTLAGLAFAAWRGLKARRKVS